MSCGIRMYVILSYIELMLCTATLFLSTTDSCPTLSDPVNGQVTQSTNLPGSTATFSCDDDYMLNGAATLNCQSSQMWDSSPPECIPGTQLILQIAIGHNSGLPSMCSKEDRVYSCSNLAPPSSKCVSDGNLLHVRICIPYNYYDIRKEITQV